MSLFLGILATVTGFIIVIIALAVLVPLTFDSFTEGLPLRGIACLAGIILVITTALWAGGTAINSQAPHVVCGASSSQGAP